VEPRLVSNGGSTPDPADWVHACDVAGVIAFPIGQTLAARRLVRSPTAAPRVPDSPVRQGGSSVATSADGPEGPSSSAVDDALPAELDTILRQLLPHLPADAVIGLDDPLTGLGLVSLAMVQLVVQIEALHAIELPEEVLVPATFATARSVLAVIAGLLLAREPAP
jgi:acyl carrier protein